MSKFYITLKIHKITLHNPKWKTTLVTSTCGSPLAIASVYLDWKLQPLTKKFLTYCKNWRELECEMTQLGRPSHRAKLFTVDGVSMYTNIDTDHGLSIVENWLLKLIGEKKINTDEYPIKFIMSLLTLAMKNDIFTFGVTY